MTKRAEVERMFPSEQEYAALFVSMREAGRSEGWYEGYACGALTARAEVKSLLESEVTRISNSHRPERADGKPSKLIRSLWRVYSMLEQLERDE